MTEAGVLRAPYGPAIAAAIAVREARRPIPPARPDEAPDPPRPRRPAEAARPDEAAGATQPAPDEAAGRDEPGPGSGISPASSLASPIGLDRNAGA